MIRRKKTRYLTSVRWVVLLGLLLVPLAANAQTAWRLGVETGVSHVQSRDLAASPLAYRGVGLPLAFQARAERSGRLHAVRVAAVSSALTNAYPLKARAHRLRGWHWMQVSYALLTRWSDHHALQHALGGHVELLLFAREYAYLDGYGWDGLNALHVRYDATFTRGPHRWTLGVRTPVLGYLFRPDYTIDEHFLDALFRRQGLLKHGYLALPVRDFQMYQARLQHSYPLGAALRFTTSATLHYHSVPYPRVSRSLNYQLVFGIDYAL